LVKVWRLARIGKPRNGIVGASTSRNRNRPPLEDDVDAGADDAEITEKILAWAGCVNHLGFLAYRAVAAVRFIIPHLRSPVLGALNINLGQLSDSFNLVKLN
jgi:hypothetical protein